MKEFEGKKLLVLGGFSLACDIITHAQAMGAYVIVVDYNENVPGAKVADKFFKISVLDIDAVVDLGIKEKIDGVATGFVDILLEPCFEICKRLGLHCYFTPKMLSMSMSKLDFKNTCNEYNIPVPQTYLVGESISEEVYDKIQYPVFIKPLDSSGSRGAGVCYCREEMIEQFKRALSFSPTNNAVIEDYLTGREFLLNYIAVNGEYRLVSMFDRYVCADRGGAINYANLAMSPSKSIIKYLDCVNDKVIAMFKSLGFFDGLFFLQGYSDGAKITFFEMGCRLGGSYYNLEKACVNLDPVDMIVRYAFTGKMMNDIEKVPVNVADYDMNAICINYLLQDREATIGKMCGIDECIQLSSYVAHEQRQFVGDHYSNEKTVDRPAFSIYLAEKSFEQAVKDVKYLNEHFMVFDDKGEYLLKEKFDLETIY